jgi:hypothetical protein
MERSAWRSFPVEDADVVIVGGGIFGRPSSLRSSTISWA